MPVSAGCDNCWAANAAHIRQNHPNEGVRRTNEGLTADGKYTGAVRVRGDLLDLPLRIKKPTVWAIWTDLFHECVTDKFITDALLMMSEAPHHTFLVLTKRSERMSGLQWVNRSKTDKNRATADGKPAPNIWLGVSVEDQKTADERIPRLLATPAAKQFVSVEPMLGPVELSDYLDGVDWVILGGETGHGARPMHPDWARLVVHQAARLARIPVFFKGFGEWVAKTETTHDTKGLPWGTLDKAGNWFPETTTWNGRQGKDSPAGEIVMVRVGKRRAGFHLDGIEWRECPE